MHVFPRRRHPRSTPLSRLLAVLYRWATRLTLFTLFSALLLLLFLTSLMRAPPPPALAHAAGGPALRDADIAACGCRRGAEACLTAEPVGAFAPPPVPRAIDPALAPPAYEAEKRRRVVRAAAIAAWDAYVARAWGADELRPVRGEGADVLGGVGATVVEALGTLYVMHLSSRYAAARAWVQDHLHFDRVEGLVSVHEVTTRILGGLLSAYHLTGDPLYLSKAEDLGMRLSSAFDTLNGVPYPQCRLSLKERKNTNEEEEEEEEAMLAMGEDPCVGMSTTQSEAAGLSVEFRALSFHSLRPAVRALKCKSDRAVQAVIEAGPALLREEITGELLRRKGHTGSTVGMAMSARQGEAGEAGRGLFGNLSFTSMDSYYAYLVELWHGAVSAVGAGPSVDTTATFSTPARGFYEYLTKAWRQGGSCESVLRYPLDASMHMLLRRAIYESPTGDLYLRSFDRRHEDGEAVVEQSMCYLPAVFHLAAKYEHLPDRREEQWREVAEGITKSCINMYSQFPTKLGGDSARYNGKIWVTKGAYRLQADLVEALFYMWRSTSNEMYREEAWKTFVSMDRECKLDSGAFTVLEEEVVGNTTKGDSMPSEFLGATMKFLYLTFSDDNVLSLDNWVFNRAGHPLLVTPGIGALNLCQTAFG